MKLSILDQSPVSVGKSAQDALDTSIRLAQLGEKLGYQRYWIAEHHDLFGLACPNPSVMLTAIGAQTSTIRIGAGAVLLPYYKPFHVAETYNLLATLFPGRIDLGLGRAPGGSAEVSLALSDNYLAAVKKYPEDITELQKFLSDGFPEDHLYHEISPTPVPTISPELWMLGTSENSAKLAIKKGLQYTFGDFMTEQDGPAIVREYKEGMKKHHPDHRSHTIVAINLICAKTTGRAEDLAQSQLLWQLRQEKPNADLRIPSVEAAMEYDFTKDEQDKIDEMKQQMIIGSPEECLEQFQQLHENYEADEYMIITNVHEENDRLKSYELFKKIVDNL